MPSKDMETFKVKDRLLLMGVLPKAGDISTIRIISELMEKLGFSEAEHKKFKIKSNEGGGVKWDDKLDKGVESLNTVQEQLKVYRQAVLKHAFEGELTAQWREENQDTLETADQLLARIGWIRIVAR